MQLLAANPITRRRQGRITAKVTVDAGTVDSDPSNDEGEGSRAVVQPRPLKILFVPVSADDELPPACRDVRDVADGTEQFLKAAWPVDLAHFERRHRLLLDARAPGRADRGRPDGQRHADVASGPPEVERGGDRQGRRRRPAGLVLAPADRRLRRPPWASRRSAAALDAAIVERQNTGGWVVAHELAHNLGWTEVRGRAQQPPRRRARARLLGRASAATFPRRRSTSCSSAPRALTCREPDRALDVEEDVGLPHDEALDGRRSSGAHGDRHALAHRLGGQGRHRERPARLGAARRRPSRPQRRADLRAARLRRHRARRRARSARSTSSARSAASTRPGRRAHRHRPTPASRCASRRLAAARSLRIRRGADVLLTRVRSAARARGQGRHARARSSSATT